MEKCKIKKEERDKKELRFVELRAVDNPEDKMIVEGYAVRFNEQTLIGSEDDGWIEIIDSRALDKTNMKDVPFKYQHGDSKGILARTRNGSLKLTKDKEGLKIRAELINTTDNVDIYKCIKAGLLYQMSFAFDVTDQEIDRNTNPVTRRITGIGTLYDVSVVDFGAYPTTSIYARSKEIVGEQLRILQKSLDKDKPTLENVDEVRLQVLKDLIKEEIKNEYQRRI